MQISSDDEYSRLLFSQQDKQRFRQQIRAASCSEQSGKPQTKDVSWKAVVENDIAELCDIVLSRMFVVRRIFQMATDREWRLPRIDTKRVEETLLYLQLRPDDRVHSMEAALLQAGAIDLLEQDCHAEMQLFNEFCEYRKLATSEGRVAAGGRSEWLKLKRSEASGPKRRKIFGMRRSKLFRRR